jgi:hypothetical protein
MMRKSVKRRKTPEAFIEDQVLANKKKIGSLSHQQVKNVKK